MNYEAAWKELVQEMRGQLSAGFVAPPGGDGGLTNGQRHELRYWCGRINALERKHTAKPAAKRTRRKSK